MAKPDQTSQQFPAVAPADRAEIVEAIRALEPHNGWIAVIGGDPTKFVVSVPIELRDAIIAALSEARPKADAPVQSGKRGED